MANQTSRILKYFNAEKTCTILAIAVVALAVAAPVVCEEYNQALLMDAGQKYVSSFSNSAYNCRVTYRDGDTRHIEYVSSKGRFSIKCKNEGGELIRWLSFDGNSYYYLASNKALMVASDHSALAKELSSLALELPHVAPWFPFFMQEDKCASVFLGEHYAWVEIEREPTAVYDQKKGILSLVFGTPEIEIRSFFDQQVPFPLTVTSRSDKTDYKSTAENVKNTIVGPIAEKIEFIVSSGSSGEIYDGLTRTIQIETGSVKVTKEDEFSAEFFKIPTTNAERLYDVDLGTWKSLE